MFSKAVTAATAAAVMVVIVVTLKTKTKTLPTVYANFPGFSFRGFIALLFTVAVYSCPFFPWFFFNF